MLKTLIRQNVSCLLETSREIFIPNKFLECRFKTSNMLKVSRLLATSLEILVANTQFLVALVTSWSQFRTLEMCRV